MDATSVELPSEKLLDRLWDFIKTKYDQQPAWLQSLVYFFIVAFFLAGAMHILGGHYVVRGVIWDGTKYAQDCEVRLDGDYFSTNSRGEYHAVFSAGQFYVLLLRRNIDLHLVRGGQNAGHYTVKLLDITGNEFEDITLGAASASTPQEQPQHSFFELIPSAYANDTTPVERLYLGSITPSARLRDATLELLDDGNPPRPLLSLGAKAGRLPLRSGGPTSFTSQYFDVPASKRGAKLTIELSSDSGAYFGKYYERFTFVMPAKPGTIAVKGTQGSVLVLRR